MINIFEYQSCFASDITKVPLSSLLKTNSNWKYILHNEDTIVPFEETINKVLKRFPIMIIVIVDSSKKTADGKYNIVEQHVIKGSSEIKNIQDWILNGQNYNYNNYDYTFNKLSDKDKQTILEERYFMRLIIEDKDKQVSMSELQELVKQYI